MNLRALAVWGGLAVAVLTAGCVATVAGQPEVDPGVIASGLSSPAGQGSPAGTSSTDTPLTTASGGGAGPTPILQPGLTVTIGSGSTLVFSTSMTVTGSTRISDRSVPIGPTSIPGASSDCDRVIAGLTAFSFILQGAGDDATATISQSTVDETLGKMPASGLPAAIQPAMTLLRSLVSSAVGKTPTEFTLSMADGKTLDALETVSDWTGTNCG